MWKLTIEQTKKWEHEGKEYDSPERVVYESEHIEDLLLMVANLSKLNAAEKTGYEIEKVEENPATTEGEEK